MARTQDEDYNNEKELKKNHSFISLKKKQKLIELVMKEHLTIYRAAKRMRICHPTAKFIIKNYRKTLSSSTESQEHQSISNQKGQPSPFKILKSSQDNERKTSNILQNEPEPHEMSLPSQQPVVLPYNWGMVCQPFLFNPVYYYL